MHSNHKRDQRLVEKLDVIGERTRDVARKFRLTAGRISQMRREFFKDWHEFCGDDIANSAMGAKALAELDPQRNGIKSGVHA